MYTRSPLWVALLALSTAFAALASEPDPCGRTLTTAFPSQQSYDEALGFFARRGHGENTGSILADFLEDHFAAVPSVEAAAACLRGSTLRRDRKRALEFWHYSAIFPRILGLPTVIADLTQDGFPIHLVRLQSFATQPDYECPWITDVAVAHVDGDRAPEWSAVLEARFKRLQSLHVASRGGDELLLRLAPDAVVRWLLRRSRRLRELCLGSGMIDEALASLIPKTVEALLVVSLSPEVPSRGERTSWTNRDRATRRRVSILRRVFDSLKSLRVLELQDVPIRLSDLSTLPGELQSLSFGGPGCTYQPAAGRALFARLQSLQEVKLRNVPTRLLGWLPPGIRRLSIHRTPFATDAHFLHRFPELETLDYYDGKGDLGALIDSLPATLRSLSLRSLKEQTDSLPETLSVRLATRLQALDRLTRLELIGRAFHSGFLAGVQNGLQELRLQDIYLGSLDADLADFLGRSKMLQVFEVQASNTRGEFLRALPSTLRELTLMHLDGGDDFRRVRLTDPLRQGLRRASGLKSLFLNHLSVHPSALAEVSSALQQLELRDLGPAGSDQSSALSEALRSFFRRSTLLQVFAVGTEEMEMFTPESLPPSLISLDVYFWNKPAVPWPAIFSRLTDLRWLGGPPLPVQANVPLYVTTPYDLRRRQQPMH